MARRTVKIIATLGQGTDEKIESIISDKNLDAVLIDNYYGTNEENSARIAKVRELCEKHDSNLAIIYDLDHIYAQNKYKLIKLDIDNVYYALKENVDFIACPFINGIEEIANVKKIVERREGNSKIIVKIDSKEAYTNLDEILVYADAIMINRDELGMDFTLEDLPIIQKEIIRKSNLAGKEVILTTQMLQSMIYNPRPTRAEVSDVANATIDGVDAVLLIEETATGYYPNEALETLNRIVCYIHENYYGQSISNKDVKEIDIAHAMCISTRYLIEETQAKSIVTFTKSGKTARFIAKYRPKSAILAVVPNKDIERKLALTWGVYTALEENILTTEEMIEKAPIIAKENSLAKSGEYVLVTLGGDSKKGNFMPTDFLTVREVE